MNDRTLKYIFGLISSFLLLGLLYKIFELPGDIIPGYFLGGVLLAALLLLCWIIAKVLKPVFRRNSFLTLFSIVATVAFLGSHYYLYSPTLKIVVPKGYTGPVTLVLSNVNENILTVDTNGIGYINKWTFEKIYTPPTVVDIDGNNLSDECVGFNQSTFWGKGYSTSTEHPQRIHHISFEIVPKEKAGHKQYYNKEIARLVDTTKLSATK